MSVIGHEAAIAALDRAASSGKPSHAWVFAEPPGIGKRTAALASAPAINFTAATRINVACDCRSCVTTLAGAHADVEFVAPGSLCDEAEHKDHIGDASLRICQVRRLGRVLNLSS